MIVKSTTGVKIERGPWRPEWIQRIQQSIWDNQKQSLQNSR